MTDRNTDSDWEYFGRTDPYWAVFTEERFRRANLDAAALDEFFASGERHLAWVLETVRAHLDPSFKPGRALDFGCGVGRLTLGLARECQAVVGVDVSESMLHEASLQAARRGVSNLSLVRGDDELSGVTGTFDLIHSYIVFQHIPCERGQRLLDRLVGLLSDGGVGAIHLAYSKASFDLDPSAARPTAGGAMRGSRIEKLRRWLRSPRESARRAQEVLTRPVMQMNSYALNPVVHCLQASGIRRFFVELTDHGGEYGAMLFFQKDSERTYRA